MRMTAIVAAGLAAAALATAGCAQADVALTPAPSRFYVLAPAPRSDPEAEVAELQGLVAELHDDWDNLSPPERQERLARL